MTIINRRNLLSATLALALVPAAVSGAALAGDDKLKVGFIYVGPIGDHGWSYQHDQGRLAIEKALGDKVKTSYLEKVPEGPDAERALERMVRSGHKLIFATSFGYMDTVLKVAKRHPDVKFEHATGYKRAANVSTYSSRFYEGRYIIGRIAAKMSKKGMAGYIASFPIPEVVRGINAFLLGAQSVNPDFRIKVVWVNTWYDPGKEADAAKVLISQGADIITQHTDSAAPMQVAAEKGVYAFGQASDMIKFGPKTQLTAIIDNWGPYYAARAKAALDGSWKSKDTWGGLKSGMVVMAPYTNMPDEVKKMAEETEAAIREGKLHPFAGPIHDQQGKLRAKKGETLDDGTLLGMNWYVKGVDDKLPK